MGMGMGGGGGGRVGFSLMRSLRRDQNVTAHKLPKGIVKRIMGFAKPYKLALALFLVLIIIDALVGAANPLVYRAIIDQGIEKHNGSLVIWLAVLVGGLAIFDAALGLWERWISSRVGEGLIFDMRNKVFIHIQRMPIAFFTRTQTGALISAAQQRRTGCPTGFHRHFQLGDRQQHQPGCHARRHADTQLADNASSSLPFAGVHFPGTLGRAAPCGYHP